MVLKINCYIIYKGLPLRYKCVVEKYRAQHKTKSAELFRLAKKTNEDWRTYLKDKLKLPTYDPDYFGIPGKLTPDDFSYCYDVMIKGSWKMPNGILKKGSTVLFPHDEKGKRVDLVKYGRLD